MGHLSTVGSLLHIVILLVQDESSDAEIIKYVYLYKYPYFIFYEIVKVVNIFLKT